MTPVSLLTRRSPVCSVRLITPTLALIFRGTISWSVSALTRTAVAWACRRHRLPSLASRHRRQALHRSARVWHDARGWFTADRRLEVSADTEVDSPAVGHYAAGSGFNYDVFIAANGYVWLSYISWAGPRRYVAVGPNDGRTDTTWGTGF